MRAVAKELGVGYATLCRALAREAERAAEYADRGNPKRCVKRLDRAGSPPHAQR